MSLDENNTHPAYLLGRLFALLENIQRKALGEDINATIKEKYFAAASTVPYSVFPRLLSGSNNHLSKIRKDPDKRNLTSYFENEISKILIHFTNACFPKHFSIEDQGRFSIGYYQQKFRPNKEKPTDKNDNSKTQGAE